MPQASPRAVLIALTLATTAVPAAVLGVSAPARPLTASRIDALPRANQSAWSDYLAHSLRQSRADRAFFDAECRNRAGASPVSAPGSSAARSLPLKRPAEWYATADARRIADIVISFQTPAGGWSKNIDLAAHLRHSCESFTADNVSTHLSPGDFDAPRDFHWNYVGTLDNDATTTELRFLAKVAAAASQNTAPLRAALLRGVDYLFDAQFPNGGWPQVWPLEGGYHDGITLNDGAMISTLEVLQDVAAGAGDFAFVPDAVRTRARGAVDRGIRCLLAAQLGAPAHRTVWAQQYDALDLTPASARNYEPAAACGSESAAIVLFLMRLPHPDPGVVTAVYAAIAWFRKTAIFGQAYQRGPDGRRLTAVEGAGPIWARYYQLDTDRPIFGDRDKSIHDDVNEISAERRNGYSWFNTAPKEALDAFEEWSRAHQLPL